MKTQLFAAKSSTGAVNSRQQSSNLSASPRFILFWQVSKSGGGGGGDRRRCCLSRPDRQTSRDFLNRIQREPRQCCAAALCLAVLPAVCLEKYLLRVFWLQRLTCKNVVVLDKVNRRKTVLVWFSFLKKQTRQVRRNALQIHGAYSSHSSEPLRTTKTKKTEKVTRLCSLSLILVQRATLHVCCTLPFCQGGNGAIAASYKLVLAVPKAGAIAPAPLCSDKADWSGQILTV